MVAVVQILHGGGAVPWLHGEQEQAAATYGLWRREDTRGTGDGTVGVPNTRSVVPGVRDLADYGIVRTVVDWEREPTDFQLSPLIWSIRLCPRNTLLVWMYS